MSVPKMDKQPRQRPYNARMSREDGRSPACEAEGAEGTGRGSAQREAPTVRPRSPCRPPAVGSIRRLCGGALRAKVRTSFFKHQLKVPT